VRITISATFMAQSVALTPWKQGLNQASGLWQNWSNAVANKQDYITRLQLAVERLHKCGSTWRESVPVHEVFQGKAVWQGDVEVFDLLSHRKAKRCYGWSHIHGEKNDRERFVAVLEIPPVDSAQKAVQVQIVKDVKAPRK
jgi:hypothetical protein